MAKRRSKVVKDIDFSKIVIRKGDIFIVSVDGFYKDAFIVDYSSSDGFSMINRDYLPKRKTFFLITFKRVKDGSKAKASRGTGEDKEV